MNYLKAVFWDYPEFTDPNTIDRVIKGKSNKKIYYWILKRFLEYGRVVDTFKFFPLDVIVSEIPKLSLSPYAYKKWKRIAEVYA